MSETFDAIEVFPWNPNFEVGIPAVDAEHRGLVALLNRLAGHLGRRAGDVHLNQVFDELAAYAANHFANEERIWVDALGGDASVTAHQRAHVRFVDQLLALKAEEATKPLDVVIEDVLRFLTHWLAYHILDSDKRMSKVILSLQAGVSLETARENADREMSGSMQVLIETVLTMYDTLSARTLELMRETTERRRLESELRQREASERRFSDALVASVPGLLFRLDDQLRLVRWNRQLNLTFGQDDATLRGASFAQLLCPGSSTPLDERLQQVWSSGAIDFEADVSLPDGACRPYWFTATPTEDGAERALIGVGIDVSRRVDAERLASRLATAVDNVAEAIVLTDAHGTIEYVNPAFTAITGYTRSEAFGQNPRILKSGQQTEETYVRMWATLLAGESWAGRLINRRKDGSFYRAEVTISPIGQGRASGYVAVQRDVSREEQLERSSREAQTAAALGNLAGGIAHDLNNLLTPILTCSDLARTAPGVDADVVELLDEVCRAGQRARDMVGQIVAFSRRADLRYQPVPTVSVAREALNLVRATLPERIVAVDELSSVEAWTLGDATQLHRVVMNLCANAAQAMDATGGTLRVSATLVRGDRGGPGRPEATHLRLEVADTGPGIPEAALPRIFEPFFTLRRDRRGTGLGLSVVQGIVDSHGGRVEVASQVGEGTRFIVSLPLIDPQRASANAAPRRVLVVADQEVVAKMVEQMLGFLGHRVTRLSDPTAAVDWLAAADGVVDVAIVDVAMPRAPGDELARRLDEVRPGLPVILMASESDRPLLARSSEDQVLWKPVSPRELDRVIAAATSRST